MPSTIVKLSSSDARVWAHNQPVWLDPQGEIARSVSPEEQQAISRMLEQGRNLNQSYRRLLPLLPKKQPARDRRGSAPRTIPKAEFAFEISMVGRQRHVTVYQGDLRYATGREVLAARLLADHGECVLHGRNGKCIGVLRDPFINDRPRNEGSRVQRSRSPDDMLKERTESIDRERGTDLPPKRRHVASRMPQTSAKARVFSPKNCPNDCRGLRSGSAGWALSKNVEPPGPNEHHPVCMHARAWAKTLGDQAAPAFVLYDLDRSLVMRDALPHEIEEARQAQARTGAPQVTVQDRVYAVLSPEDAERAGLEARGEIDDEADLATGAVFPPVDELGADGALEPAQEPVSSDLGEDGAPDTRTLGDAPTASSERSNWPTFEELHPSESMRRENAPTRSTYLLRRPGSAASP